jgi:hypothetical protein
MDKPPPVLRPAVRYRVTAPFPVSGGVQGVGFANGHAVADADKDRRALAWFRAEPGYAVELIEEAPAPADVLPEAPGDAKDADDEAADEVAAEPEEGPEWL